ncbi:MAG: hypothetical protein N3B21_14045 [Clostridia bacterium]|nr:hypothetical protein [Clostridia bacterium]
MTRLSFYHLLKVNKIRVATILGDFCYAGHMTSCNNASMQGAGKVGAGRRSLESEHEVGRPHRLNGYEHRLRRRDLRVLFDGDGEAGRYS